MNSNMKEQVVANETTKKTGIPASALIVVGALLLALGIAHFVLSLVGTGRELSGALFFDDELVSKAVAEAQTQTATFREVCADGEARGAFDDTSVKEFDEWCDAVEGVSTGKTPESVVNLLRKQNQHFSSLTSQMTNRGGHSAERSGDLLAAVCSVRPPLEDVFSQTAGAAFSQAIIGIILAVIGGVVLRRGRKRMAR